MMNVKRKVARGNSVNLPLHTHLQPVLMLLLFLTLTVAAWFAVAYLLPKTEQTMMFLTYMPAIWYTTIMYILAVFFSVMMICYFSRNTDEAEEKFGYRYRIVTGWLLLLTSCVNTSDVLTLTGQETAKIIFNLSRWLIPAIAIGLVVGTLNHVPEFIEDIRKGVARIVGILRGDNIKKVEAAADNAVAVSSTCKLVVDDTIADSAIASDDMTVATVQKEDTARDTSAQ